MTKFILLSALAGYLALAYFMREGPDNSRYEYAPNEEYTNYLINETKYENECKFWTSKGVPREGC